MQLIEPANASATKCLKRRTFVSADSTRLLRRKVRTFFRPARSATRRFAAHPSWLRVLRKGDPECSPGSKPLDIVYGPNEFGFAEAREKRLSFPAQNSVDRGGNQTIRFPFASFVVKMATEEKCTREPVSCHSCSA